MAPQHTQADDDFGNPTALLNGWQQVELAWVS
jgi:hypothetical protein